MKKIKCLLENKNGSMMMDYFVIAAVGVLLLGATMLFLTGGKNTMKTIMGRANNNDTQSQDQLGSFY